MMTGFDRLIMDAHLIDGEYDQACDVWQEALYAQTTSRPLDSVAEGADLLIDHARAFKKHNLAYRVMDVQNKFLPYGDKKSAQHIAKTGSSMMEAMLHPYWGKDRLAVSMWEKTVGYLKGRDTSVRDSFVQDAGNNLIDAMIDKEEFDTAQKIRVIQEDVLLADNALTPEQFARNANALADFHLNERNIGHFTDELRYQNEVMSHIDAMPHRYIRTLQENAELFSINPTWYRVQNEYQRYPIQMLSGIACCG